APSHSLPQTPSRLRARGNFLREPVARLSRHGRHPEAKSRLIAGGTGRHAHSVGGSGNPGRGTIMKKILLACTVAASLAGCTWMHRDHGTEGSGSSVP